MINMTDNDKLECLLLLTHGIQILVFFLAERNSYPQPLMEVIEYHLDYHLYRSDP